MDAVKFLKEWSRMCKAGGIGCFCDLNPASEGDYCDIYVMEHPEESVAIVEKWSVEHPAKTRQSEFLKMFPDALITGGVINIDPCRVWDIKIKDCPSEGCEKCRKDFWLAELPEDK